MKFKREKKSGPIGIPTVSGQVRQLIALIRDGKSTQPTVAHEYQALFPLVRGDDSCWTDINAAISERWPRGLNRVKVMAWKIWEV